MSIPTASVVHSPAADDRAAVDWADPSDRDVVGAEHELRALSEALASLLARDGDDPQAWTSPPFVRRVAAARSIIATVDDPVRLATGLKQTSRSRETTGARRARVRRLAGDPVAVAIVLRWHEIRVRRAVPGWSELVRRRSLEPPLSDPTPDVGHWFG